MVPLVVLLMKGGQFEEFFSLFFFDFPVLNILQKAGGQCIDSKYSSSSKATDVHACVLQYFQWLTVWGRCFPTYCVMNCAHHLQHSQLIKNPSEYSVWFMCTVKLAQCEQRKRKACQWLLCIGKAGQEVDMDAGSPECFIHRLRHSAMDFAHSTHCWGRLLGNFQFFSFLSYLSGILWGETFATLLFIH